MTYADHIASGRCMKFIEEYMTQEVRLLSPPSNSLQFFSLQQHRALPCCRCTATRTQQRQSPAARAPPSGKYFTIHEFCCCAVVRLSAVVSGKRRAPSFIAGLTPVPTTLCCSLAAAQLAPAASCAHSCSYCRCGRSCPSSSCRPWSITRTFSHGARVAPSF